MCGQLHEELRGQSQTNSEYTRRLVDCGCSIVIISFPVNQPTLFNTALVSLLAQLVAVAFDCPVQGMVLPVLSSLACMCLHTRGQCSLRMSTWLQYYLTAIVQSIF